MDKALCVLERSFGKLLFFIAVSHVRKSFSSGVQSHTIAAVVIPSQRHPNHLDVGGIEGSAWMSLIGKNQKSFRYNCIPETEGQPLRYEQIVKRLIC